MSKAKNWLNDNAGGGDTYDGVTFENQGDGVRGKVMDVPFTAVTQYGERLVINLQTAAGPLSWWVKPGTQAQALIKGLADANVEDVEVGGDLAVAWTDSKDTGKGNPMKLYTVKYVKPAQPAGNAASAGAGAGQSSIFDGMG